MTKIYVGNLPFSADEAAVRQLFEQHGKVESVALINDRDTGRPRGFGFVEMSSSDAARAIQSLNGQNMGGRPLRVNEAQERGGGGGGGGGFSMAIDNLALRRRGFLLLRRQKMNTSTPKAKHVAAPPATAMPTISPVVSLV